MELPYCDNIKKYGKTMSALQLRQSLITTSDPKSEEALLIIKSQDFDVGERSAASNPFLSKGIIA